MPTDPIEQKLDAIYDGRGERDPLVDVPILTAALAAVLRRHDLRLYDRWDRHTTDASSATSAWCEGCGRHCPVAGCSTRQDIARELRVSE